jgi:CRP-like cAMP-binding protein
MSGNDQAPPVTLEVLSAIPMFAGLSRDHLTALAEICHEEQHAVGTKIFSEGDPGDKLFVILSGAIRISHKLEGVGEEALAVLEGGSYFGEMALLEDAPRSADAIVHKGASLLTIGRTELEQLLFVDRELAYAVLWTFCRTLSKRLRETNEKMKGFMAMAKWV